MERDRIDQRVGPGALTRTPAIAPYVGWPMLRVYMKQSCLGARTVPAFELVGFRDTTDAIEAGYVRSPAPGC